jgi:hypothetical protein
MQGGNHLPQSDQKRLDEVRQIREAMASGGPILVDKERTEIIRYTEIMVMDGELFLDRLLSKIEEQAKGQPMVAMKVIREYVTHLGKQAAQQ